MSVSVCVCGIQKIVALTQQDLMMEPQLQFGEEDSCGFPLLVLKGIDFTAGNILYIFSRDENANGGQGYTFGGRILLVWPLLQGP